MIFAALTVFILLGGWFWLRAQGDSLQSLIARLQFPDSIAEASTSTQEASIRAHSLDRVIEAIDMLDPVTRNEAAKIAAEEDGPFRIEQVARIWSHVRSQWRYVNDPRGDEYFALASETITNGYVGDCDDFAIVLVAMLTAVGGDSRLVMMDGTQGGHAYAEVCVQDSSEKIRDRLARHYRRHRYRNLGRQRISRINYRPGTECPVWLNLDWNAGVPGGKYESENLGGRDLSGWKNGNVGPSWGTNCGTESHWGNQNGLATTQ